MKTIHVSLIALTAAAATMASCKHTRPEEAAYTPAVDVAVPEQRDVVLYKNFPGTLHASSSTDLVARVNGILLTQNYENGALVEPGQVLFTIESTSYADAVSSAEAQLSSAQSQLEYATRRYAAVEQAAKAEAASLMEVAEAKSNKETAQESVKNAAAALQTARTNLSYCTIRAPYRGHVSASAYGAHHYVDGSAGAPLLLATIYDDSQVRADFYIDDNTYIEMVNNRNKDVSLPFDSVPVTFGEDLPHKYTGRIVYMSPSVNPETGTMELRAMIDNPDGVLRAGMYASVSLPCGEAPNAILVKDASLGTDQRGKYLYTVNDSNQVVYTPVEVGDQIEDTLRIVTSGLRPGQRYVTKAMLKVHPGMTVKPVEAK